jgi:hypothetical protein
MASRFTYFLLIVVVLVVLLPSPTAAFGAGNIASISKVEGQNFRHGVSSGFQSPYVISTELFVGY